MVSSVILSIFYESNDEDWFCDNEIDQDNQKDDEMNSESEAEATA